jgi:hypothetical protein
LGAFLRFHISGRGRNGQLCSADGTCAALIATSKAAASPRYQTRSDAGSTSTNPPRLLKQIACPPSREAQPRWRREYALE